MAKAIRELKSWTEVAPAPIIYPKKPSNSPRLDTIIEESNEEEDAERSDHSGKLFLLLLIWRRLWGSSDKSLGSPTMSMDSNNEYYNLEADDERSRVDEDVHFRQRRRQRDLDDDDVVPIHPLPDPHLNPPRHTRRRGQPRVVRLQQQVD
ncbi:hypothetical protein WN943_003701 [Citrus x changshan-huyou]